MNVSKLTPQEKQAIIDKSPLTMPTNPTKAGWNDGQIKQRLAKMVTDETDSVLAALDKIVDNVNDTLGISVGNVVVLTSLPVDLTDYEGLYILIKDGSNNIINSYFVQNGVAIVARFGSTNNVVVSEDEPISQLDGDLWFDIDVNLNLVTLFGGLFTTLSFPDTLTGGIFNQTFEDTLLGGAF